MSVSQWGCYVKPFADPHTRQFKDEAKAGVFSTKIINFPLRHGLVTPFVVQFVNVSTFVPYSFPHQFDFTLGFHSVPHEKGYTLPAMALIEVFQQQNVAMLIFALAFTCTFSSIRDKRIQKILFSNTLKGNGFSHKRTH